VITQDIERLTDRLSHVANARDVRAARDSLIRLLGVRAKQA
jgi:hypothetical protein